MNKPYPSVADLAHAFPPLTASALWRVEPEDFQVDEELGFEPDGEGEHVLLQIRKRDANTDWIAKRLARFADVKPMDVSYAGMKDRYAVTTQWFSVRLAGKSNPDWDSFNDDEAQVLQWHLHKRKLKRGSLRGNRFVILLREVKGERAELEQRLSDIAGTGVPNYFTEQRFGRDEQNLPQAEAMLSGAKRVKDRNKRSIYLSAARSFLFNQILSARVTQRTWNQILPGEIVMLAGSRSSFIADEVDDTLRQRLAEWDINPSGPMPGDSRDPLPAHELTILEPWQSLCTGLKNARVDVDRRALRLRVQDLKWEFVGGDQLRLEFGLGKGSYASAVVRELMEVVVPERDFSPKS
ncbi:MAG: tRNA pseudouridine(13) synthase TruD [Gammaproteobacteria bacterium]|nr:tRNA pseudouridine(13) synthase TruD [Gammaproteobacteria bacterium]MDH5652845.1 tRNA pseudouridine(13) synthase TruD [Gammaproteobacteria bacterium]